MLQILTLTQVLLWSAALLGAFVFVRGWFEAPVVRRQVMLSGLVLCIGAVALLLHLEGSAWRWPAGVLMLAVAIAMAFAAPRSVWPKLRWMIVGGIGMMFGIWVLTWLSDQMSPVVWATMLAFLAGMAVLFFVSITRLIVRGVATTYRSAGT